MSTEPTTTAGASALPAEAPMTDHPRSPLDYAKMPPWLVAIVALGGGGAGLSALGLQQSDPPATHAEVVELESQVDDLAAAVTELTILVRVAHTPRD